MKKILFLVLVLVLSLSCSQHQDHNDRSNISFTRDTIVGNWVEYRTGNFPLIVTVPHGGSEVDTTLEIRTQENCNDPKFVTVYDTHTPELADLIDSVVFARTGMYPHIVFMRLKRTYIDVNREFQYAIVTGCKETENVYNTFYCHIKDAKNNITDLYGSGILLDLHSHGHEKQEIEIGYQITKDQLNMSDEELNRSGLEAKAGIYNQIKRNKQGISFAEHLRGEVSFGSILNSLGTPCIPHSQNKHPLDTKYFSGGYITKSSGSCSGGTIDALQLELNTDSHMEVPTRTKTAENLVKTVEKYLYLHYNLK